ncbi:MAG TPA: hypothetical protein VI522_01770 [Gammaproteobacteria bacterium]|nr:hypothetical protein [Gammaproteobacteria bacterium]
MLKRLLGFFRLTPSPVITPHARQVITHCQQRYEKISGFNLAKEARNIQQLHGYEYIYGEVDLTSFAWLLRHCYIDADTVFYDLGSGVGKAVVCAAQLYDFKKVCGIEQLTLLYECAQQVAQQLPPACAQKIVFHQADLLTVNFQDADIVFINATAFLGDFWQALLGKLQQLKPGTSIILVTKHLFPPEFEQIYTDYLPMSWGLARVGVYRCLGDLTEKP